MLRLSCESRAYSRALVSSNRREMSRAPRGLIGTPVQLRRRRSLPRRRLTRAPAPSSAATPSSVRPHVPKLPAFHSRFSTPVVGSRALREMQSARRAPAAALTRACAVVAGDSFPHPYARVCRNCRRFVPASVRRQLGLEPFASRCLASTLTLATPAERAGVGMPESPAVFLRVGMPAMGSRALREMQSGAVTKAAGETFWRAGLGRRATPPVGR